MALHNSALLLVQLLDRLLGQHKAGLNPTPGQVEDLTDLKNRVRGDLDAAAAQVMCLSHVRMEDLHLQPGTVQPLQQVPSCAVSTCPKDATTYAEGETFCGDHAALVARVVSDVRRRLGGGAAAAVYVQLKAGARE